MLQLRLNEYKRAPEARIRGTVLVAFWSCQRTVEKCGFVTISCSR
jgi:hypothetical protein